MSEAVLYTFEAGRKANETAFVLSHRLASREALGEVDAYGEGRGIVFTAGDGVSLSRVVYTLRMLRKGEC